MSEWVGWLATAVFVCSYFVRPSRLLAVQAAGALTWLAYGVLTGQPPVIVSNIVVAGAAGYRMTVGRLRTGGKDDHGGRRVLDVSRPWSPPA